MEYSSHIVDLVNIAKEAGKIILSYYDEKVDVNFKSDDSPVTAADLAANRYIVEHLQTITPDVPVVSEENPLEDNIAASQQDYYWLVDPLDGTKSFIKRTGEFTVNIALIKGGVPVGGVVYIPVTKELYYVGEEGQALREVDGGVETICVRDIPKGGVTVVASQSHSTPETEEYINTLGNVVERISVSSSLKFCRVAEGRADVYPRFGRTMHWDTGAGHAVLRAAGGDVVRLDKSVLEYKGQDGDFSNPYFIAFSHRSLV